MKIQYNVEDSKDMKKLDYSKRFFKYPDLFMNDVCEVKINGDSFLKKDKFILHSKEKILPRKIFLYGKKNDGSDDTNNLYLNYWMKVFLKTIEKGNLYKYDCKISESKIELCIGLPLNYRRCAFNGEIWTKNDIIKFLSCLFSSDLEEVEFEQQDFFESLVA